MTTNYKDFWASTLRFCKDFADEMQGSSVTTNMSVINFDAFAEIEELDQIDLIGPKFFSTQMVHSKLYTVTTSIVLTTFNDPSLFRLEDMVGRLFDKLSVDKQLPIFNADTGARIGTFKVMDGTEVIPVLNTKTRAMKAIAVNLASDRSSP